MDISTYCNINFNSVPVRHSSLTVTAVTLCVPSSSCNYIQVAWISSQNDLSWEPASSLPHSLVKEFEDGIKLSMETVSSEPQYGVITHTLINSPDPTLEAPPEKCQRIVPPNFKPGYGESNPWYTSMSKLIHVLKGFRGYTRRLYPIDLKHRKKARDSIYIVVVQVCYHN